MSYRGAVVALVNDLADYDPGPLGFNPWRQNTQRRLNLADHLNHDHQFLFIGEAPGYQGCRHSGVPFTSEYQVFMGQVPWLQTDAHRARLSGRETPWKEPSATIVWKALYDHGIANKSALWNAYPFHPMKAREGYDTGDPETNRTPTDDELRRGRHFLERFLALYPGALVFAVGKKAMSLLMPAERRVIELRHPANGGATKFRNGLADAIAPLRLADAFTLDQAAKANREVHPPLPMPSNYGTGRTPY